MCVRFYRQTFNVIKNKKTYKACHKAFIKLCWLQYYIDYEIRMKSWAIYYYTVLTIQGKINDFHHGK